MDLTSEISKLIGQEESNTLEYKAVLPPSNMLAQSICSFANVQGGFIVIGVADDNGDLNIHGLSNEFYAVDVVHKAIDLLTPSPNVIFQYISFKGVSLFVIKIDKSDQVVSIDGKIYVREGSLVRLTNPIDYKFKIDGFDKIKQINEQLEKYKIKSTNSKMNLITHYQSILKIVDNVSIWNYQDNVTSLPDSSEGKLLTRILYSSFVDNFETYLSDLLYEIFLAIPNTLKSKESVTIEEVLNFSDLQDFIKYWAKRKIEKLQKGSISGFIEDTSQIKNLNAIDNEMQNKVEKYLQIRHLYTHRNGKIDEKFLKYFPGSFEVNNEHILSLDSFCEILSELANIADIIDNEAIIKYKLSFSVSHI